MMVYVGWRQNKSQCVFMEIDEHVAQGKSMAH